MTLRLNRRFRFACLAVLLVTAGASARAEVALIPRDVLFASPELKKGVTIGIERGTQFVAVVVTQAVNPDTTIAKVLAGLELREIKVGDRARILWDNPRSGNDPKKLRAKLQGWKRYKELKNK